MPVNVTCGRCYKQVSVDNAETCWYCGAWLCVNCWDKHGHCGHPEADEENERMRKQMKKQMVWNGEEWVRVPFIQILRREWAVKELIEVLSWVAFLCGVISLLVTLFRLIL